MQVTSACVDVVPLFLGTGFDFQIDDEELIVSCSPSLLRDGKSQNELTVCLQHIPTGISVQSSGTHLYQILLYFSPGLEITLFDMENFQSGNF